jgi:SHS2 domain-containing protein
VIVSAWAPTVDDCLAEAALGLVSCFADLGREAPQRVVGFACDPGPEPELLVELLDEVVYVVETQEAVPAQVSVAHTPEGGLVGEFGMVDLSTVELIGPAPKAVTRHGLRFERGDDGTWRCEVVIDV